jgi:diguanylate cyclase (GGDEF)-like protein
MTVSSTSLPDLTSAPALAGSPMVENLNVFRHVLLETMREGAVFVDAHCRVMVWNRGMELLTGLGNSVIGSTLTPSLLQLTDADQVPVPDRDNPFLAWLEADQPVLQRFSVGGRSGRKCDVELSWHPVRNTDGKPLGGLLLLLDTSVESELQRRLDNLQTMATIDPLTQVGNRAEFERLLDDYVRTHKQVGLKCSIIVGDLDYFKKINDTWGHHIGDHALVAFAQLLKHHVRGRDFVARYGGEEFVILCANCDEIAAAERGERIRKELAEIAQPIMQGQKMTASFGVTELRDDDSPTTLFVRADKALMWAKKTGRNRVVTAGLEPEEAAEQTGVAVEENSGRSVSGANWPKQGRPPVLALELAAPDLLPIFVEKLKAWIEECKCRVDRVEEREIRVSLNQADPQNPKSSGQLQIEIDLITTQEIERPTNLPNGTRVVLRVSVFGKPTMWRKIDFESLSNLAVTRLRSITGLQEDKFLVKWPKRKREDSRRY